MVFKICGDCYKVTMFLIYDTGVSFFVVFHCFTSFAPCYKFCLKVHL